MMSMTGIGTLPTCGDVRHMSVVGAKAEVPLIHADFRLCPKPTFEAGSLCWFSCPNLNSPRHTGERRLVVR